MKLSKKQLGKMLQVLENERIKVESLGFVEGKELKAEHVNEQGNTFYCNKDLSFWNLPQSAQVKQFMEKEFDYLINIDCMGILPMQAISAKSNAKIRMAKHFEKYSFAHDFMAETNVNIEWELFEEIIKYIK